MNIILSDKLSKKRMEIIKYLNKRNIGTSIYYPQPVPRMSYYKKKYGYKKNNFTNAAVISDRNILSRRASSLTRRFTIHIR